ncbi:hypothetical protein [Bacillus andreraoultii]|nr:hypothetical protein [Bacillus andreraoultii]
MNNTTDKLHMNGLVRFLLIDYLGVDVGYNHFHSIGHELGVLYPL